MDNNWITAEDIDAWATKESRRAQETLPVLLAKLIHSSSNKIDSINVQDIQSSGYDITLTTGEQTNYFPKGKSVWELGIEDNALGKFKEDIKKRSESPLGVDMAQTVFIFVTIKIWSHRDNPIEKAINDAKKKYNWKDIRIIDAHELSRWLEFCPSVAIWFSKSIGKHISGVVSAEHFWDKYGNNTDPLLTPDCLMIGREYQIKSLSKWLLSPNGYMVVKSESSLEAKLFTIATVLKMEDEQRDKLLSCIVIVDNDAAWSEILDKTNRSTILIPIFPISEIKYPRDVNVLFPISKYDFMGKLDNQNSSIDLPKYRKPQFDEMLKLLGYDLVDYASILFDTKRSFPSLYRKITTNPTRREPEWAKRGNLQELLPAMLAGTWNDNCPGDRRIIEILSNKNYDEYMSAMHKWANMEDAPFMIVSPNNYTISFYEIWSFLYMNLTDRDNKSIEKCVLDVFSQIDPTFELPEEQWPYANIYGIKYEYSQGLIRGLIISLIMISERDGQDNNFDVISTKRWVDSVIMHVLAQIHTWQHWSTIAPSLSLLAEASPIALIEKLEDVVNSDDIEFWKLFYPSKDEFLGRNYYTHILWALEILVWNDECAVRAIRLLGQIGEKNIEYKITNSPHGSLYAIFCLWYPRTCLSLDDRMELLGVIVSLFPATGWKLLNSLSLKRHSSSMGISKPRWREFNDRYSDGIQNIEYYSSVEKVLDMSLQYVDFCKNRWLDIIDKIDLFWNRFNILSEKMQNACEHLCKNDIFELCDKLREKISLHRQCAIADWSVSEDHIVKWESLLKSIMPDTIGKYKYLLKINPNILNPIPYDNKIVPDYEQRRLVVYDLRKAAFNAIIEEFGDEALIEFCADAEDTQDWGQLITENILRNKYDYNRLRSIRRLSPKLYSTILWVLFSVNGLDVLISAIEREQSLTKDEVGEIMCCTPLSMEVWLKLKKMDRKIKKYYWENVRAFRLSNADTLDMEYYIEKLLYYKRPFSVINIISFTNYDNSQTIMSTLSKYLELQDHIENNGLSAKSIHLHKILALFEKLYNDFNVEDMDIARLEVAYMPYFQFDINPKGLMRCFTKMPELYIEFISMAYKPDNDSGLNSVTEKAEHVVRSAHDAIERFHEIPGCNGELIDENFFGEWIHRAERIASELGYKTAFEICLGRLLSYSPLGNDGIFPHEIVRKYFETNLSDTMKKNFIIEKMKQRGVQEVTWGDNENRIAQKYKTDGSSIRITYPKTASILDKLSECYLDESRRGQLMEYGDFYT